jgi:hypothetical protein
MSSFDGNLGDVNLEQKRAHKTRSAMGVGIPTIVTILVVLMFTSFAVLSLVSARSDLNLSRMAADSAQAYYKADSQAVLWYAQLNDSLEKQQINPQVGISAANIAALKQNYTVSDKKGGGLRISEQFALDTNRELAVTVKIDTKGKPEIIQWQTTLIADDE